MQRSCQNPRSPLCRYPCERISMDLFEYEGWTYFITVDYYSRWVEMELLTTQTAKSVITAAKERFSTHGIPDIVISDNGPCFSALSFQEFAAKYGFLLTTSSPRYPRVRLCPCVYLLRMFFTCNACWDLVIEHFAMLIKEMLCWVAVIPFYGFYIFLDHLEYGDQVISSCSILRTLLSTVFAFVLATSLETGYETYMGTLAFYVK